MTNRLSGQVALVTGSASGIGEATARRLAAEGALVVVNSTKSTEAGSALAAELDGTYLQADIAVETEARRLVAEAAAAYGRLDILVNNAGTTVKIPHSNIEAVTGEVWSKILGVNVIGTWNVTAAAVPHLREAAAANGHSSAVVNVSSL